MKMADFANQVRGGEWKGHTGKRIRNVSDVPAARLRPVGELIWFADRAVAGA